MKISNYRSTVKESCVRCVKRLSVRHFSQSVSTHSAGSQQNACFGCIQPNKQRWSCSSCGTCSVGRGQQHLPTWVSLRRLRASLPVLADWQADTDSTCRNWDADAWMPPFDVVVRPDRLHHRPGQGWPHSTLHPVAPNVIQVGCHIRLYAVTF